MPTFQQMVHDRSQVDPQSFLARGSLPSPSSPLSQANRAPLAAPNQQKTQPHRPASANDRARTAPIAGGQFTQSATQQSEQAGMSQSAQQNGRGHYEENRDKRKAEFQALKEELKRIQVSLVAQRLGGTPDFSGGDRSKWRVPNMGKMSITGQKWWNFLSETGGYGAITFVEHVKNIEFRDAVKWLTQEFADEIDSESIKAAAESGAPRQEKKSFTPPLAHEKHLPAVKHYLRFNRRIPALIIDQLVARGSIYADEHKNCIFYSDGIAEVRSSFDGAGAVKKLVTGSTRKAGFVVMPDLDLNERTLAICEAAIDAMSYRALNPGRSAISSAGAGRSFPRAVAEDAMEKGFKIIAAFDADKAGDNASQALFNHFYLKLWLKHKIQAELGKEMDDDELFDLLDKKVVTFRLPVSGDPSEEGAEQVQFTPEQLAAENKNLLFFNKAQPFEDAEAPPTILVEIKRNELGLPQCQDFPLEVSRRGFNFVVQTLGVSRDRPRGEKDWNELLKKVGPAPSPTPSAILPPAAP